MALGGAVLEMGPGGATQTVMEPEFGVASAASTCRRASHLGVSGVPLETSGATPAAAPLVSPGYRSTDNKLSPTLCLAALVTGNN